MRNGLLSKVFHHLGNGELVTLYAFVVTDLLQRFSRIMIVRMISVSGISGSLSILPTIDAAGRSMCTLNL